ncbi:lipopolysaccharide kinase (Kdo/WaaP) family protein [Pseudaminobacter salicylatoxidans]|uniref:Lipopolysaccharide kinase (Kdo/WaaP) family protein n=1 Tax=Pseudaminobacter salicylatoxidans TaxID=93369 RepID=A0A316C168_PSESE|nr:lipopolysaccharide kinase InaA family protein [Pseudaminobacter salicylatoxidans]PWJ80220.1 lipopolysaccharide kinase (Kdo/WaaP) family protein [Pseudaminobacter salicylatoxidans]
MGYDSDILSPAGKTELLGLLAARRHERVSSATVDGRIVWIKRYDVEGETLAKRLHHLLSPLLPAYLRASPRVDGAGFIEREIRKMDAFRAADFPVADVIYRDETVLVLSNVEIVQKLLRRLRETDPQAHDELLVGAAAALGRLHRAGLCHGRPHPRDMFVRDERWGFIDFEEEPERIAPLASAQARDVWLLFLQVSSQALLPDTEQRALTAYRAAAPAGIFAPLRDIVRVFSPLILPLRLLDRVALGKDGRRVLKATSFLNSALAAMASAGGHVPPSPAIGRDGPKG